MIEKDQKMRRFSLPVAMSRLKSDDGVFFVLREVPSLDTGLQILAPPQSTTLPTPVQPRKLWDLRPPCRLTMSLHVSNQFLIFFRSPWTLLQPIPPMTL